MSKRNMYAQTTPHAWQEHNVKQLCYVLDFEINITNLERLRVGTISVNNVITVLSYPGKQLETTIVRWIGY